MTRYVSQPVEVEAFQLDGRESHRTIARELEGAPNVHEFLPTTGDGFYFLTLDGGSHTMDVGDWLIRRPNGAVSVLPNHIFTRKYTRLLK